MSFTAGQIGDPQVRHRGTIGGSLAHGDPASDLPTVILALDGELVARGPAGDRAIAATEFFTGVFQTALAPDEMLVEIRVPKLGSAGWSYTKMNRRAQDWATVAVAAVSQRQRLRLTSAIALTNMGATPLRATCVRGGARGRLVDRGRSRARGRRNGAAVGSRGERGVPRATSHAFSRKRALDEAASR